MNLLTPWFRQGRSSYGDVGPLSGEDRVDPNSQHKATISYRNAGPSGGASRVPMAVSSH